LGYLKPVWVRGNYGFSSAVYIHGCRFYSWYFQGLTLDGNTGCYQAHPPSAGGFKIKAVMRTPPCREQWFLTRRCGCIMYS
jgi:hypothetical protein